MNKNFFSKISIIIILLIFNGNNLLANQNYDGTYNASFDFKMGSMTVCPKRLPIEIEVIVKNGVAEGYIFNNGGGNGHKFCKLYHNGEIKGKIDENGNIKFKIKQKDSHSKQYSSYKITGQIEGRAKLTSRNSQYHPSHKFEFSRVVNSNKNNLNKDNIIEQIKNLEELLKAGVLTQEEFEEAKNNIKN